MDRRTVVFVAVLALMVVLGGARAGAQVGPSASPDYVVGIPDVLTIAVWKQPDLTGKFTVDPDGMVGFPLIGRVKAAGLKAQDLKDEIARLLADGFLKDPQVTVIVEAFRSQQVFVLGDARSEGVLPLTGGLTVVEALTRAGALADSSAGTAIVLRRKPESPDSGPVLPGRPDSIEVQRLAISDLRAGRVGENLTLQPGDTVFITQAEMIFVFGQVSNPGSYVFEKDMTVDRALKLAGGALEIGAPNRATAKRIVDGKVTEVRLKLTDAIQPGDSITVPRRRI